MPGSVDLTDDGSLAELFQAIAAAPAVGPMTRLEPGTVLDGEYRIEDELGSGGMGVVYLARDLTLHRRVAIKLHRRSGGDAERYLAEATALARIGHPAVVAVYRAGIHEGQVYIAMEHVAGGTLRDWLATPRPRREVLDRFAEAGRGLAAAHAAGLVHCDVKPDNLLLGDDGRVRVADFGLARVRGDDPDGGARTTGGTPAYMAPEQRRGEQVGPAADQFAFCAALWDALTGEPPFGRDDPAAIAARIAGGPAEPRVRLPGRLRRLLIRGMSADPAGRFRDMDALLDALDRIRRRPRWPLLAAGLATAAVVVVLLALPHGERPDPCAGAGDPIDRIWSLDRRSSLAAALGDPARPWTVAQWHRIEGELDGFADGWRRNRVASCREAAGERPEAAAARGLCLDRQRDRFRAVVSALAVRGGDPEAAPRAVDMLPPVDQCATVNPQALPPAPADADAGLVAAARAVIGRAQVLIRLGRHHDAAPLVDQLDTLTGHDGATDAAIALTRASLALGQGREQAAAEASRAAYLGARRHHHTEVAIDAAGVLAEALVGQGKPGDAATWAELSLAEAEPYGAADHLEIAISALASVRQAEGRYQEALALRRRQIALIRAARLDHGVRLIDALDLLAQAEDEAGEPASAVTHYREALERVDATLGPDHPARGRLLANLGLARAATGDYRQAEDELRRALALAERDHPGGEEVAYALLNLGVALGGLERHDEAIAGYRRALAILEARLGPDHPDVALVLNSLGVSLVERGQRADALDSYQRALAITRRALGADHPTAAVQAANIADLLLDLDRTGEAAATAAGAVASLERGQVGGVEMVHALTVLGRARLRGGATAEAVRTLQRAVALGERDGVDPNRLDRARALLTRALATRGRGGPPPDGSE